MKLRVSAGSAWTWLFAVASAGAQTIAIEHQGIGCLVADNYPELTACFQPSSDVAKARVQFRAAGTIHWYFVEMSPGGACYSGTLPKPQPSTKEIEYYIDVASKGYGESRTPDYSPRVASGLAGCRRRGIVAGFATSAAVRVFAPVGAPPIPAGFSGAGVVTTTGAATGPAAAGSGGGAEPATAASKSGGKAAKVESGGGGAPVALALVALGAAGAGVYVATKKDPLEEDNDGDGLSEKDGDCDDTNKDVSPNGGFNFTMDFAFTGPVGCSQMNPRQQSYRVQNLSCATLTVESLTHTFSSSGACDTENSTDSLSLLVRTVAPGATATIRTGGAAGTSRTLCCPSGQRVCNTGTCNVAETYTVKTSAGSRSLNNSFAIGVNTPSCLPSCDVPVTWPFAEEETVRATRSRIQRCD